MSVGGVSEKTASIFGTEMAVFRLDLCGGDLREVPDHESLCEVRCLDVSKNSISKLDFVSRCPNIIDLNVSENQICDGLSLFGDLKFLTTVNLSCNLFEQLSEFQLSDTIMSLDLSGNHLSTVSDLPCFPRLENLNLSKNAIKELGLPGFPSLRVLNLSGNLISELVLPTLPSLRILDASGNNIERIHEFDDKSLEFLWSCDLRHNSIGSTDVFRSLSKLPTLYTLFISENPVCVEDQSHVSPVLVILPALTILDGKLVNAKDKVKASLDVNKACGESVSPDYEECGGSAALSGHGSRSGDGSDCGRSGSGRSNKSAVVSTGVGVEGIHESGRSSKSADVVNRRGNNGSGRSNKSGGIDDGDNIGSARSNKSGASGSGRSSGRDGESQEDGD